MNVSECNQMECISTNGSQVIYCYGGEAYISNYFDINKNG